MSENDPENRPANTPESSAPETGAPEQEAATVAQPVVPAAPATAPAPVGPRLRDTVWNFKAMLAVALASLLVGGLGGAVIVALADGDDQPERIRIANFGDGPGGRGEFRGPFGDGEKLKEFREWRRDHEFPPLPDRPDATPSPSASPSGSAG